MQGDWLQAAGAYIAIPPAALKPVILAPEATS